MSSGSDCCFERFYKGSS